MTPGIADPRTAEAVPLATVLLLSASASLSFQNKNLLSVSLRVFGNGLDKCGAAVYNGCMSELENSVSARYDDAVFLMATGDVSGCISGLEALLGEIDGAGSSPMLVDIHLALSMAYMRDGRYPEALEYGQKAERLRPNDPFVHTNLSMVYVRMGKKREAEEHSLRAKLIQWKNTGQKPHNLNATEDDLRVLDAPVPQPMVFTRRKEPGE